MARPVQFAMAMGRGAIAIACAGILACTGDIVGPGGGAAGGADGSPPVIFDADPAAPDAAPGDPDAGPAATPRATGIRIRQVSIYQGIEVVLAQNGSPVSQRTGPVVEGAAGMMGVFVDLEPDFEAREIRAVVTIDGQELTEDQLIRAATGESPQQDGFTVDIPAGLIATTSSFSVELREVSPSASYPGSNDGARYPETAEAEIGAASSNGPLELVLVPFRYDADGSGRLPPTDANAIAEYERLFRSMYPVAEVDITVRQAVPYSRSLGSSSGWSTWLDTLVDIRSQDGAADNVYYYGMMSPTSSISSYCRGGCVLGLGYVPSSRNSYLFASVGVSFADSMGIYTALHEVGHTAGRNHAPCGGVSGADPGYPHSGGGVGVWGYDVSSDSLKDPDVYTDVMGYCRDQWISDYTYNAIFDRISTVNQTFFAPPEPRSYRVGLVDEHGRVTWRRTETLQRPLRGDERRVALLDDAGDEVGSVTGHFFAYDHIPGGTLMVPVPGAQTQPAAIDVGGVGRVDW